jgi:hypothetical protein
MAAMNATTLKARATEVGRKRRMVHLPLPTGEKPAADPKEGEKEANSASRVDKLFIPEREFTSEKVRQSSDAESEYA